MLESRVRPRKTLQKKLKDRAITLLANNKKLILLMLLSGFGCLILQSRNLSDQSNKKLSSAPESSSLIELRQITPSARASQLKVMAEGNPRRNDKQRILDRHRARYLLGSDLVQQQQGKLALTYLQGLGQDYPLLRPQILWKIAQAHQQNQQTNAAQRTLKYLIKSYPDSSLTANALSLLDEDRVQNEAQIIKKFPYHPIAQKIARQRLSKNPQQFQLLLLLAKYSRDSDLNPIRDRLVLKYPAKLTPEDWQAIADGYWREEEHRKAADAYTYASSTPQNLYRAARGFHRNGNLDTAKRAYQRLLQEYHDSREAGEALIYLANISSGDEAVVYLEKAIAKFPNNAPEAYRSKAIVHERFDKNVAADEARQNLLNQYNDSSAAGEYRWKIAQKLAASGSKKDAWQWMQPLVKSNSTLEQGFAPKALYWTGKWAKEIGKLAEAETTFKKIIKQYPQSYWAWRSAVMLGWDVGDFDRLRSLSPPLNLSATYSPLPVRSSALQELYLLGQYYDAGLMLRSQLERPQQLSVNEQFSEGILRIGVGEYSAGMQEIWDLTKRETPQELKEWKALRQTTAYWRGLFPFPYQTEILDFARQDEINPLLVLSVMRKESTFNPEIDSVVGAVGLMQIVPPTAKWVAEQLDLAEYSLTNPEDNIKIGTWYLKHNHDRYEDNSLYAVASYNAGTGNVSSWLDSYNTSDPDLFVEQIPFPETKDYVEGVFGNYWNYLRLYNPAIRQKVNSISH
ncbi:transglycosylase SLT domain-containing protein [Waterburya agarophytonicola K14]|uniref:Transglycosylase SLT domain-containing protein n=1 Tax=Waterburya agarophytonicola KI4 TaxID=2874699 RepID=A0A964BQK4_9CYAN|nr:transglycosylase SLT domain-containing protein [Waterburya agarophytonicola]MCC0177006.1 transglycosylase SLT domain-containing protein [Waterburya agarophytonicola KI4]